ncbi:MAG: AAA family ATPase, partial [Gammaproteobacteria bacterium]
LTDTNGRKVDFRNVILVMTTNAGASEMSRSSVGFTSQDHQADGIEIIKRTFTPEFRNRMDAIIQFSALDKKTILYVVEKFVSKLEAQLESKNIEIQVEASAKEWIAERGYDVKMGARPMERVIQEHIKKLLAEEILFGRLENGGKVVIRASDEADDETSENGLEIEYLEEVTN